MKCNPGWDEMEISQTEMVVELKPLESIVNRKSCYGFDRGIFAVFLKIKRITRQ